MRRIISYLIVFVLCCTLTTSAHETYVRPISGWANLDDTVFLPLGSGHSAASTELPVGIINITVVGPSGDEILDDQGAIDGFWTVYNFNLAEPGLFVVDGYHSEGAWTRIVTAPPTEGIWEHNYVDDIDFDSMDKAEWADDWYVEKSYVKHCSVKAFVAGPEADFSKASEPVGQLLEIVPLDNITAVGEGDFQFQVLFNGEPFSGADIWAVKVGDDSWVESVTDDEGKAVLNLTSASDLDEWIVKSITGMDTRVMDYVDQPRGDASSEKTYVGPSYITALTLRTDYVAE